MLLPVLSLGFLLNFLPVDVGAFIITTSASTTSTTISRNDNSLMAISDRLSKENSCEKTDFTFPPSWEDLDNATNFLSASVDGTICQSEPPGLTFYRERNGWCIYSSRIWLALELKGIQYETILVEAVGDDYEGWTASAKTKTGMLTTDSDLHGLSLPKICWNSSVTCNDYDSANLSFQSGSDEELSLLLLEQLDVRYPDSMPLWPNNCNRNLVTRMAKSFHEIMSAIQSRPSPRAAFLFKKEEGYRLDPLPRDTFVNILDKVDQLLSEVNDGPYFCGDVISAADVVWAPILERYAAQLPCLHSNLQPRNNDEGRWSNINRWYDAMDNIPAYSCRVKGDGPSWRRVLYVEPWWPSPDVWHHRDTVGPNGELKLSEDEVCAVFGNVSVSSNVWGKYASSRMGLVCPDGPMSEAASTIIRNRLALLQDSDKWLKDELGIQLSLEEIDVGFRSIAWALMTQEQSVNGSDSAGDAEEHMMSFIIKMLNNTHANSLLLYLVERMCVPRDMGAPCANAIRILAKKFG